MKYLAFLTPALFLLLLIATEDPYKLGLKKPHFKAGDCVSEFNEFGDATRSYEILEVGKTRYKHVSYTLFYKDDTKYTLLEPETTKFWMVDDYATKVTCPAFKGE
jgi:hypothetical protein